MRDHITWLMPDLDAIADGQDRSDRHPWPAADLFSFPGDGRHARCWSHIRSGAMRPRH